MNKIGATNNIGCGVWTTVDPIKAESEAKFSLLT